MQLSPPVLPRARRAAAAVAALATAATLAVALPAARGAAPSASITPSAAARIAAERAAEADRVARAYPAAAAAPTASAQAAHAAQGEAQSGQNGNANGANNPRSGGKKLPWQVGFAKASLDPTTAELASGNFHLGGYGILPTRRAQGPLVDGDGTVESVDVRAMAVSDKSGHNTLLLAALENQGTFAADKQGPYGIYDIRQKVAQDTGVPVDMIVVNSDHSHAGPDLIGLWGGVPVEYLQYVHDQTVAALEAAYRNRVPAQLLVGSDTPAVPTPAVGGYIAGTATPGEHMVHSQFGTDSVTGYDDGAVDTELRVLQAVDGDGRMLGTFINYAAHATVMGGGNVLYSADWPGRVARATEAALNEPVAVTMVADVGRSQPPRPHSNPNCGQAGQESCDVDQLDTYTHLLAPWVVQAVATATPVQGSGVAGSEVMTREAGTNGALIGVSYTGEVPARGYGAYRAATPPWFTGTVVGTFVSAHRIGNVLLTAAPGEAYPDIRFGVKQSVRGMQSLFTFGLANDQLGYLIAPTSEYAWITASNPGNDNAFFNVAAQYGDHVMCSQTALAVQLGFTATGNAAPYGANAPAPNCTALTATDLLPTGPAPQQPWPFGDGTVLPSPFPQ
jgi:nucleoid-associated protein YgaU